MRSIFCRSPKRNRNGIEKHISLGSQQCFNVKNTIILTMFIKLVILINNHDTKIFYN